VLDEAGEERFARPYRWAGNVRELENLGPGRLAALYSQEGSSGAEGPHRGLSSADALQRRTTEPRRWEGRKGSLPAVGRHIKDYLAAHKAIGQAAGPHDRSAARTLKVERPA